MKTPKNSTYWALADARTFCEVAEQLGTLPSHMLPRRKLATILSGPLDPLDENPADASVQARNFLAELELAADRLTGVDRLVLRAINDDHTQSAAGEVVERFLQDYGAVFSQPADSRIIGLAFIVHFLVYSAHRNIGGIAFNVAFVPWAIREHRDRTLLERFAATLAANTARREPPGPSGTGA